MKPYISLLILCLSIFSLQAQQTQLITDTAIVKGNCGMCKKRIENALKKEKTATGTWNPSTQKLIFSFNPELTSKDKVLKRIAEAGHDNERYTADKKTYETLPHCCSYRPEDLPEPIENTPFKISENMHKHHQENTPQKGNNIQLENIVLSGNKAATSVDKKGAGLTFNIDKSELMKAACCNLSESFETNATVDVSYANAVTGAKQIKMLGIDQKYTLITTELFPEVRGLSSAYGMGFIPGRWINSLQLTKGGSSVAHGYESISGQINTEFLKFKNKSQTALNIFANANTKIEGNLTHTHNLSAKWSQSFLIHGNSLVERQDKNNDGFMDLPVGKQINTAYLLDFNDLENSGFGSHFGINFLNDNRTGGEIDFHDNKGIIAAQKYGVTIDMSRLQAWNKTGYIFKEKPYQSIGFMNKYTHTSQKSSFGKTPYNGTERSFYSNLIFESILGSTLHKYKTGASFLYDEYSEFYQQQPFQRIERVPGIFYEYTYTGTKLTIVGGARIDFHNLAGTQFTPRINIKYNPAKKTTLRVSAGKGFRTANIFAESQLYMASNRKVEIIKESGNIYGLNPEIAWNYGLSLQQDFPFFGRNSTVIIDFFRTNFKNQILPDLDASTHKILFHNMNGNSFANSLQIQWDAQPIKNLEVRLAYKKYDTRAQYTRGEKQIPFTPQDRAFANIAYKTYDNQWSFDTTLQWIGKQRLPESSENPTQYQWEETANPYFLLNAQLAYQPSSTFRIYAGAENILSHQQTTPIIDAQNPFGNYFDGGMIYAPIMPINAYAGIDIQL